MEWPPTGLPSEADPIDSTSLPLSRPKHLPPRPSLPKSSIRQPTGKQGELKTIRRIEVPTRKSVFRQSECFGVSSRSFKNSPHHTCVDIKTSLHHRSTNSTIPTSWGRPIWCQVLNCDLHNLYYLDLSLWNVSAQTSRFFILLSWETLVSLCYPSAGVPLELDRYPVSVCSRRIHRKGFYVSLR